MGSWKIVDIMQTDCTHGELICGMSVRELFWESVFCLPWTEEGLFKYR
jgi:hypothetical protein